MLSGLEGMGMTLAEMEALDVRVAQEVMGWHDVDDVWVDAQGVDQVARSAFCPSRLWDVGAGLVLEKIGISVNPEMTPDGRIVGWYARPHRVYGAQAPYHAHRSTTHASTPTVAICLAALAFLHNQKENP